MGRTLGRRAPGGLYDYERRLDYAVMFLAKYGNQRLPDILAMNSDEILYWFGILEDIHKQENARTRT